MKSKILTGIVHRTDEQVIRTRICVELINGLKLHITYVR
ncbi:hypothetical protein TDSAC_0903 [Thermodesulfobium acidiphilum]|uniref:Uncharacterized protein n=1 Tax=Thermodesulfobium acidiphilum TaxID=1794699 RepID=A0A2R4W0P1_THEAF|nr:hypothetical protein TDSAC_0903 [Thermodesulfobium acidiphilum]